MSSIQVNFQIDNELLKDVDLVCGDWGRSEFIRVAIEEKTKTPIIGVLFLVFCSI